LSFCGAPKKEKIAALWKLYMCQGFTISKMFTKQTNPLQAYDLITNNSLAILEASKRILNTVCQNLFLQM